MNWLQRLIMTKATLIHDRQFREIQELNRAMDLSTDQLNKKVRELREAQASIVDLKGKLLESGLQCDAMRVSCDQVQKLEADRTMQASQTKLDEVTTLKNELKETKRQLKLASSFHENCVMESPEYKKLSKEALSYRAALKIIGYNMSISWSKCVNTAQEALVK